MNSKAISIGKFEANAINEDAAKATDLFVAVSDGAGGGGVYAERWSNYLLDKLPEAPILSADELDQWIGQIWEPFYNECETLAQYAGGLLLDKFYDEGSFATLVAIWKSADKECRWMSYGDSVAFHYNKQTKKLEYSIDSISTFNKAPYLINCKDELNKSGFNCGTFDIDNDSVVFVASDALAHYILMMYEVANREEFASELSNALSQCTKNSDIISVAQSLRRVDFEKDVIDKLCGASRNKANFVRHIKSLLRKGLIATDDYSFAIMTDL